MVAAKGGSDPDEDVLEPARVTFRRYAPVQNSGSLSAQGGKSLRTFSTGAVEAAQVTANRRDI